MIVILDNIRSLHNIGAIFRTADALGVEKIYLTGISSAPIDRFGEVRSDIAKTALGAEKTVAWQKSRSLLGIIDKLKKDDYTIIAVEIDKRSVPYYKIKTKSDKLVIIVGSEVKGLSQSILKKADVIAEIPMSGALVRQAHHPRHTKLGKESLNVAVAFGIVGYRLKYKG